MHIVENEGIGFFVRENSLDCFSFHDVPYVFWIGKYCLIFYFILFFLFQKVLKVKFRAYTVNQILRHDEIVRKNWKAFENGELKFDDELQKIYSSFVGRSRLVADEKGEMKWIS